MKYEGRRMKVLTSAIHCLPSDHLIFTPRKRKLLLITKTLLNAIAPAASIGLR